MLINQRRDCQKRGKQSSLAISKTEKEDNYDSIWVELETYQPWAWPKRYWDLTWQRKFGCWHQDLHQQRRPRIWHLLFATFPEGNLVWECNSLESQYNWTGIWITRWCYEWVYAQSWAQAKSSKKKHQWGFVPSWARWGSKFWEWLNAPTSKYTAKFIWCLGSLWCRTWKYPPRSWSVKLDAHANFFKLFSTDSYLIKEIPWILGTKGHNPLRHIA